MNNQVKVFLTTVCSILGTVGSIAGILAIITWSQNVFPDAGYYSILNSVKFKINYDCPNIYQHEEVSEKQVFLLIRQNPSLAFSIPFSNGVKGYSSSSNITVKVDNQATHHHGNNFGKYFYFEDLNSKDIMMFFGDKLNTVGDNALSFIGSNGQNKKIPTLDIKTRFDCALYYSIVIALSFMSFCIAGWILINIFGSSKQSAN